MTTTPSKGDEPILLAFSGGLDTSFCVPWLKDTYQRPVITVTVDVGQDPADIVQAAEKHDYFLNRVFISVIASENRWFSLAIASVFDFWIKSPSSRVFDTAFS